MRLSSKILICLNRLFPKQIHPFNLRSNGQMSYARWQYFKGEDTISYFEKWYTKEEMFKDKVVLDMGCGAAGKSLYYASLGAKKVVGMDIIDTYSKEAMALAEEIGLFEKFEFIAGDAAKIKMDQQFDTIIMNDFMEHTQNPEQTLRNAISLLSEGGRIYLNFPPYNHPFGAHLSDAVGLPWVHTFFSDKTLIEAYRHLVKDLPDGEERISFRISKRPSGEEYFSYINKMTLKKFKAILKNLGMSPIYYEEVALRSMLKIPACLPYAKEYFVKMAVCVIEAPKKSDFAVKR